MFLLVRTKDQIKKTEKFFADAGIDVMSCAVSSTVLNKIAVEDDDEGFIVTSPNAVLSIPQTRLPFFCVGEATAKEAEETGRRVVYVGYRGAKEMAEAVARKYPPEKLVHAAGDTADTSWYGILAKVGIEVEKRLAYGTKYHTELDPQTIEALKAGKASVAVLFSVQGARHFTSMLKKAGFKPSQFRVITFSSAIADQCSEYHTVYITPKPSLAAVKNIMQVLLKDA